MENYSIFSGLKGFVILNLLINSHPISSVWFTQKWKVDDLIKIGNEITYDIDTVDMWLEMTIECSDISLVINFEIKVEKKLSCGDLKSTILDIINLLLAAKDLLFEYDKDDIKLIKGKVGENTITTKESRSPLEALNIPKKLHEIYDDNLISEHFDYINRYLICTIKKNKSEKTRETLERKLTINSKTSVIVTDVFDTVKESMPCRGIQIESWHSLKHSRSLRRPEEVLENCCRCIVT
jgi:hypothetical protein